MIRSCTRSRLIANHLNVLASAVISATTQRPSDAIRLLDATPGGSGSLHLAGPFTGAVDSDVEAEIISLAGGTVVAGTPVTHGVGSGTLSVTALRAGAGAETLELTLLDAGEPAKAATYDFFGYELAARVPGAAGNGLALTVERRLLLTPTRHRALERIAAGTTELTGPVWEWGQPAAQGASVPPDALRIQFDGHPAVHRAWRQWRDNAWVYRLDPAPAFDVLPDTRILAVAGDYRLTLSDGVTTETFDAVTIHDFLAALDARSALVEVRAPLSRDRTAGGMSVLDVPLRSDAHALPPKFSTRLDARIAVTAVDPAAPTGNLTLTHAGAGRWSVSGPDGSPLPAATVGEPYVGPVSFTLSAPPLPQVYAPCPTFAMSYARREDHEGQPAVCLKPFSLGASARDKELTFIYTRRPPAECSCAGMAPLQLSAACLGLEDDMSVTDPEYLSRIKAMYAWRAAFVRANTEIQAPGSTYVPGTPGTPGTPSRPATEATTSYRVTAVGNSAAIDNLPGYGPGIKVRATVRVVGDIDDEAYANAAAAALDGASLPTGTRFGQTVTVAGYPVVIIEWGINGGSYDFPNGLPAPVTLSTTRVLNQSTPGSPAVTGSPGTAGTPGYTVSRSLGYLAYQRDLDWMEATLPILIGCLGQIYSHADALTLWDALWAEVQGDLAHLDPTKTDLPGDEVRRNQRFLDRYAAVCDTILLEAGILPKTDASGEGSACWRDHGDAFWWTEERGEYLPAFNNRAYISARRDLDGVPYSTREFGFGLLIACPERLKEGDRLTIRITGTANAAEAGEGDTITIPVVAGQVAYFSYGAGGQPVQTWTVRGSVSGALPDWLLDLDDPQPYAAPASPAELALTAGGIPFEAGDRIRVDLFAGRLRWRRDGGAWSEADIFADHDVGDGLTLSARVGSAPAFAVGNRWRFAAEARYGVSKLRQPRPGEAFAWDGDSVMLTATWPTPVEAEVVAVALADLPPGAVLTLTATDAAAVVTTTTANVIDGVALFRLGTQVQLAEARLSITHAGTGGAIGWLFAGMGWRPTVGASTLSRSRQYGLTRGARAGSGALYSGRGVGGEWSWQVSDGGVLLDDTCRSLQTLLDHVATHDNEPILLVPDLNDPTLASVAVLAADEIRFDDELGWQGGEQWRHVSVSLPFDAVLEAA